MFEGAREQLTHKLSIFYDFSRPNATKLVNLNIFIQDIYIEHVTFSLAILVFLFS